MNGVEGAGQHQSPLRADGLRDKNEQPVAQKHLLLLAGGFGKMERVELFSLYGFDADEGAVVAAPFAVGC